jgi:WD40 repeat protein
MESTKKPSISPRMELVQQKGFMWYLVSKIGAAQHEDGSFSNYEFPESIRKQILNYVTYTNMPQWKLCHLLTACTKSIHINNSDGHQLTNLRRIIHNPCKPEIATISDNIFTITDTITGETTSKYKIQLLNNMRIQIFKFNHNGTSLAIGGSDLNNRNLIIIFDLLTKNIVRWVPSYGVSACDFNADGTELITTYKDQPIIEVWNSTNEGPKSKQKIAVPKPAYAVTCCPVAQVFATGHTDGTVTLWNANTYEQGAILTTNASDKGIIDLLTFNHDGTKLAAGSTNVIKEVPDEHNNLLTAEVAHVIQTWNTKNKFEGKHFTTYSSEYLNRLLSIAYDPASRYIISFSSLPLIRFWDINKNTCILTLNGNGGLPFDATFNPLGSHVIYPATMEPTPISSEVIRWDLSFAHKVACDELTYEQACLLNTIAPEDTTWKTINGLYQEYNGNPKKCGKLYYLCKIIKESFINLPESHRNKLIQIGFDVDKPQRF